MMSLYGAPFLNIDLINYLYDNYELKKRKFNTSKTTFELSFLNTVKFSQEFKPDVLNSIQEITNKFTVLYNYLDKENNILKTRPKALSEISVTLRTIEIDEENERIITESNVDTLSEFVEEEIVASKFIIPSKVLESIFGIEHMIVWVAEPNPNQLSSEPFTFTGTFLYLIETIYDNSKMYRSCISGCSALQTISNMVLGNPYFQIDINEPLGRNSIKHPRKKLESIGAYFIDKRKIKTLYKMRYMSNEQCFTYKKKKYRCNDLLGYPLIIE